MKKLLALAALPMIAAPAMAAPYVESKTNTAFSAGNYVGTQTELRIGYQKEVAPGVAVYGEIGPGYQWRNGSALDQYVTSAEIGVLAPIAKKLAIQAKAEGDLGGRTDVFNMGTEVKIRYTF
jgi:opacity protein-like surface antigen